MGKTWLTVGIVATLIISACSSTSDPAQPAQQASIASTTRLENENVSGFDRDSKNPVMGPPGIEVRVQNATILTSEIRLLRGNPWDSLGYAPYVTMPVLMTFVPGQAQPFQTNNMSPGIYSEIGLQRYRIPESEISQYASDPRFADFTTEVRSSVVIKGVVIRNGVETPFTYEGNSTEELPVSSNDPIIVQDSSQTNINFVFDASRVFQLNGIVLDPLSPVDIRQIDRNMTNAIRAEN